MIAATLALVAVVLLAAAGCERSDPAGAIDVEVDAADRERLHQLGYLDYAEDEAGPGGDGVVLNDARAHPGYSLYATRNLCLAELIDMSGAVLRSWRADPCRFWSNAELQPDGSLLVTGLDRYPDGSRAWVDEAYVMKLSWDGDVVWKRAVPAHHDVEATPSGRILTLTMGYRRIPDVDPDVDVIDNGLALLSGDGEPLEELSLYDLLSGTGDFRFRPVERTRRGTGWEIDFLHANSVETMDDPRLVERHALYALGNVLFCSQRQDTIAVVDWRRKQIVWKWGQGELSGPHHPTVLANGHILVFDNGVRRGWSRVIELDPTTESIVWEYRTREPSDFFTRSRGAVQRFPNGNTLVTNSDSGEVFEVTAGGERVWQFNNPHLNRKGHRATIVRMRRYDAEPVDALLSAQRQPFRSGAAQ